MTRTRIRSRGPLTVTVVGGGGGGTNPAGSSLTTDGFFINIKTADAVTTPTENLTFALKTSSADTGTAPAEASGFNITPPTDTVSTPTGGHSTAILAGATTVTQTTGTGWTSPANAQGLSDAVNATITSASGVTPATATGTLTGVFNTFGTVATETQTGTVTLTFYSTLTLALLTAGSLTLTYSTDGGVNYSTAATFTATATGNTTVTLTGFLLANLGNLRFRAAASVIGGAVTASTATLDAVVASFTTTGSAG
jgi:hypothetical protein